MAISSMFGALPPQIAQILGRIPGQTGPFVPGQTPPILPTGTPSTLPTGFPSLPTAPSDPLSRALSSPAGQLGARLLAESGPSLLPTSFGSSLGRAALGTVQDQRQQQLSDLQQQLIASQLGLNRARAQAALTPGSDAKAATARGKANQDLNAGLITPEQHQSRISEIEATETRATNKDAATLRSERDTVLKASSEALQSLRAAESLLNAENPFADVASLTSFIRSIDNSVVRPSEQANFDAALGLVNQMEAIWQRAKGEGTLTPDARAALRDSIGALRENYETIIDGQEQFFVEEAQRSNVDPARVLRGVKVEAAPERDGISSSDTELNSLLTQISELQSQLDRLESGN